MPNACKQVFSDFFKPVISVRHYLKYPTYPPQFESVLTPFHGIYLTLCFSSGSRSRDEKEGKVFFFLTFFFLSSFYWHGFSDGSRARDEKHRGP